MLPSIVPVASMHSAQTCILLFFLFLAAGFSVATIRGWHLFSRYIWAIQIGMIDAGSSMCSLSVLLSAVKVSPKTQTGQELHWQQLLAVVSDRNTVFQLHFCV